MSYNRARIPQDVADLLAPQPWLFLREVAGALGLSRATIERALAADGMTFRAMSDAALLHASLERLRGPGNASLKVIADQLHFSSESSFSHFIKRTTGLTPSEIRALPDGALA